MDKIRITGMSLRCIVGVNEHERREKREVVIGVCLHADLSRAVRSDSVAHTVDYEAVEQRIVHLVDGSDFHLLEALAEAVAQACLEFDGVEHVSVTVEKPGALTHTPTVAIEIARNKHA